MTALAVRDVRELRAGGQKTVHLVERGGIQLVMKVISLESGAPDALRRAEREVELLEQVNDDHVVKVRSGLAELGTPVHGVAWLEEYLDGDDLGDLLGPAWTWEDTRKMAQDVAQGLSALHAVRVVHRDLSANNIRRKSDGTYVVMDPGFARHTLRSGLTVGGQPGTYGFLSPEHLGSFSGTPTPASDIFCLGILMFYALAGQLPIPLGTDLSEYLSRLSRAEIVDIETIRQDLLAEVVSLIRRMLHPHPGRRPRNGARAIEALEAIP